MKMFRNKEVEIDFHTVRCCIKPFHAPHRTLA